MWFSHTSPAQLVISMCVCVESVWLKLLDSLYFHISLSTAATQTLSVSSPCFESHFYRQWHSDEIFYNIPVQHTPYWHFQLIFSSFTPLIPTPPVTHSWPWPFSKLHPFTPFTHRQFRRSFSLGHHLNLDTPQSLQLLLNSHKTWKNTQPVSRVQLQLLLSEYYRGWKSQRR